MSNLKMWILKVVIDLISNDPTMIVLILVMVLFIGYVWGVRSSRGVSVR